MYYPITKNIVNERMNSKLVQNMYLKWVKSKPSKWKVVGSLVLIKEKVTTLSTGGGLSKYNIDTLSLVMGEVSTLYM